MQMKKIAAAFAACAVSIAGACILPAAAIADDGAKPTTAVESGTLTWGVKDSFRNYIMNFAVFKGRTTAIPPAVVNPASAAAENAKEHAILDYPVTPGTEYQGDPAGTFAATGAVHFQSHPDNAGGYILDLTFSNPQVTISDKSATLSVEAKGYEFVSMTEKGPFKNYGRVDIAHFGSAVSQRTGDTVTIHLTSGTLTKTGAPAFGTFYEAGTPLDNATLVLKVKDKAPSEANPNAPHENAGESASEKPGTGEGSTSETSETGSANPGGADVHTPSATAPASNLAWGFKESFRTYIVNKWAAGTQTLSGGATDSQGRSGAIRDAVTEYRFPLSADQRIDLAAVSTIHFDGSVTFTAHAGAMNETLKDFQLVHDASGWHLVATVTRHDGVTTTDTFVTFDTDPTISTAADGTATLTFAAGTVKAAQLVEDTFGTHYKAGTELDPLTVTLAPENQAKPSPVQPERQPNEARQTPGAASPNKSDGKTLSSTPKAQPKAQPTIDTTKKCVVSGSLNWAIKDSFNSYVQSSIAHGSITLSGVSGKFTFPISGGKFDTKAKQGTFYYSGSVHYSGHQGVLDVTVSNPILEVNGTSGVLYADVKTSDMSGNKKTLGRVAFADVAFSRVSVLDSSFALEASSVTLTAAGAQSFAGFYSAGQQLALLSSQGSVQNCQFVDKNGTVMERDAFGSTHEASTLAATGAQTVTSTAAAGLIAVVGVALVALARRRKADELL